MQHISIRPIKVLLKEKYLYDMDESKKGFLEASLIGVSSYQGSCLTFHVLIKESGALFSYIPIDAFLHPILNADKVSDYSYKELDYHFCTSDSIEVFELVAMNRPLHVWIRNGEHFDKWKASYIFTVDWPEGNTLQHFVLLESGQYALVPNHKLSTINAESLPKYKKLRQEWC